MPENLVQRFQNGPDAAHVYSGATEIAEGVIARVKTVLGDSGLSTNITEKVEENNLAGALNGYGEKRLAGKNGDTESRKPGFVAFVTETGKDQAVKNCDDAGYPITGENVIQVTDTVWALNMPEGLFLASYIYDYGNHPVGFTQSAPSTWEENHSGYGNHNLFHVQAEQIIRIEGTGGGDELWQCPFFNVDGTPKEASAPVEAV